MSKTERDVTLVGEPFALTLDAFGRIWLHAKVNGIEMAIDLADKDIAFAIMAEKMSDCGYDYSAVPAHGQADNDDQRRP